MRKKFCGFLAAALLIGTVFTGCGNASGTTIPVQSVSMLMGYGGVGMYDRYAGLVEAGETVDIEKSDSMEVGELLVKAGQDVQAGDVLFTYDTETISLDLEKMTLELEQLQTTIDTKNSQIKTLEKEKAQAASSDQLDYTLQIQELQIDVKETEYNLSAKQREIEHSQEVLDNATVTAPVSGTVSSINTGNSTDDWGNPLPYISILQAGEFRVKGIFNEQSGAPQEGTPVIIRARTGDATWTGTITLIDWEHPQSSASDNYYYVDSSSGDEMTTSSNYPFYITLDSDENLMLGQHVYIEPDLGQDEEQSFQLFASFIIDADSDPYVWVANKDDQLEKRSVTLGAYDEATDQYEVLDGLELTDYIAYPSEDCDEGISVEYYSEDSFGGAGQGSDPGAENGGVEDFVGDDGADGTVDGDATENIVWDDGADGTVDGDATEDIVWDDGADGAVDGSDNDAYSYSDAFVPAEIETEANG